MKYSQIKQIKDLCNNLASEPDFRGVVENLANGEADFEVNNVRFINSENIDEIQQDELGGDEYLLGCFNASFLAGILDCPILAIEKMQEAEAYGALGCWIVEAGKLEELQEEYVRYDGYGHHFNHYDGGEEELSVGSATYYVFDNQ